MIQRWRAMLNKEAQDLSTVILWGVGIFFGLPLLFQLLGSLSGHSLGPLSGTLLALVGPFWAVVVGIATVTHDFQPRLESFWRSRPIPFNQWIFIKFLTGAFVLICVFFLCIFLSGETSGGMIRTVWFSLLIYGLSVLVTTLTRRAVSAAILIFCLFLLVFFLPLVVSDLQQYSILLFRHGRGDPWHPLHYLLGYSGATVLSLALSWAAARWDWQINLNWRTMFWVFAAVGLVLMAVAARQVGSNLRPQQVQNVNRSIYRIQASGREAYGISHEYQQNALKAVHLINLTLGDSIRITGDYRIQPAFAVPQFDPPVRFAVAQRDSHLVCLVYSKPKARGEHLEIIRFGEQPTIVFEQDFQSFSRMDVKATPNGFLVLERDHFVVGRIEINGSSYSFRPFDVEVPTGVINGPEFVWPLTKGMNTSDSLALTAWCTNRSYQESCVLHGDYMYASDVSGITIYKLSRIDEEQAWWMRLGQVPMSGLELVKGNFTGAMAIHGNLLYTLGGGLFVGLKIYDISNPEHPRRIGHYAAPGERFYDMTVLEDGRVALTSQQNIHIIAPPKE